MRRIDFVGRGAFGALCVAGLALVAIPLLIAIGPIGAVVNLIEGDQWRAFWVWVGSWTAAGLASALFFVIAYFAWPLASDWITEWQGYAIGIVIGGCGLGLMVLTVVLTTWPLAAEISAPMAATFLAGFALPGRLLGLGRSSKLPLERERHAARERERRRAGTP